MGTSTVAGYEFFAYRLYQQLDRQMLTLADAAAHGLAAIKAEPAAIHSKGARTFDNDGDLDIPWQDLRQDNQGVEWFDASGQLLGKAGTIEPVMTLAQTGNSTAQRTLQHGQCPLDFSAKSSNCPIINAQIQFYVNAQPENSNCCPCSARNVCCFWVDITSPVRSIYNLASF